MQTIHRGNAAEAAVLAALSNAGIPAMLPFGQGLGFDLGALVPPVGDLLRIQVKSGRIREGCVRFNACSTDHGAGRQPYTGRADLIAVHVPEPDQVFMVPVEDCPSFHAHLRLEPTRNNQRRRIRLAVDYEFDTWARSLFDALD